MRHHVLIFGDEEGQIAAAGVVEEGGEKGTGVFFRRILRRILGKRLPSPFLRQRHDGRLIERDDRPLGSGVVAADRLDVVADELDADGVVGARRKPVHDAAANAEFAVLIHRIFTREAGVRQKIAQLDRAQIHARLQIDRRRAQSIRMAQLRQQRRTGRHDNPRGAGRQPIERGRARRGDVKVGRQLSIRIDLQRRKRPDHVVQRGPGGAFQRAHEKADVARKAIHVLIGGHHDHRHRVLPMARLNRDVQRLSRR